MKVNLKCNKRNLNGSYEGFVEWDIIDIDSKELLQNHQETLEEVHTYRRTRIKQDERMFYICDCNRNITIEMAIVKRRNTYRLRNSDGELHKNMCPFFTLKTHHDEQGRVIALSPSMFKLAQKKQCADDPDTPNINTPIGRVNTKQVTTFNGLMYSLFDSMNISMNRNGNYKKSNACQQFIGRFLNTAVGVDNAVTFIKYRNNLKENQYISFDVGFINDSELLLGKTEWNKEAKKFIQLEENNKYIKHTIDGDFVENIENKKFNIRNQFIIYKDKKLVIMENIPIVKNLVMGQTLQGIRNYDNFTEGPYFFVKVGTRQVKEERYSTIVQFFLQPIYMSEKYILPVESRFERECIQYLDETHDEIQLYKPMTLDKTLFFKNLQIFLTRYPNCFSIYKQACETYDLNKVIRPDLFMLKETKLYVFEFAGYNYEKYLSRLQKKEEEFYIHFDNIVEIEYIRISIDSKIQDFHDSRL